MNTLLNILIFLPLIAGITLLALPSKFKAILKPVPLGLAAAQIAIAVLVFFNYTPEAGFAFQTKLNWLPFLGIEYHIGLDGLSLFLMVLSVLFIPVAMLMATDAQRNNLNFGALLLILESGLIGTVLSLNLFLFYIFWELMLVPSFFLIGFWGGEKRVPALSKFIIYTMAGSLILLFSILFLGNQYFTQTGQWTFSLLELYKLNLPGSMISHLLFLGFAVAFFIKTPLFPFHTWLPDTYCESPTSVTFILSGIMAKMGVYGLIRITFPIFPHSLEFWAPYLSVLAVVGVIYGALVALGQEDLKRLIAYSSMSHMSLILLGVFAWNQTALTGSIYQMINHAISTGALFLMVGLIEKHYGTTEINSLGGVAKSAPLFGVLFMIFTFSSIGVPGLNGFVGEFMILLGVFLKSQVAAGAAALTLIFSAAYMLWLTQRLLFGETSALSKNEMQLSTLNKGLILPFVLAVFTLGLCTSPITKRVAPGVEGYIQKFKRVTQTQNDSVALPHTKQYSHQPSQVTPSGSRRKHL